MHGIFAPIHQPAFDHLHNLVVALTCGVVESRAVNENEIVSVFLVVQDPKSGHCLGD